MPGNIIILHKCTKNHDHMLYCPWDMALDRCNCYFSFWTIFCSFTNSQPLLPNSPKNENFKKWKKRLKISSFYTCVPKIMIRWCTVPKKWCASDWLTDGQKKWRIEVGAPPKKSHYLWLYLFSITLNCVKVLQVLTNEILAKI